MQERRHTLNVWLNGDELAKLHRIAKAQDRDIARIVRNFIHTTYEASFGDEKPPKPKLKHSGRKKAA